MKLITIFNFPDEDNYNQLCMWWLTQAIKYAGMPIEVWTNKDYPPTVCVRDKRDPPLPYFYKNTFDLVKYHPNFYWDNKAMHNVGFKLYNLCQETEPFIFVDADAIIFEDLGHLVECSKDKPVIMVDHESVPGHTSHIPFKFLNSGVQVVSDPSLLDFDKIMTVFQEGGSKYMIPGTDQALLFQYFKHIGYDYTHPKVGPEWNHCAGLQNPIPMWSKRPLMHDYVYVPVCINHYWYNFKPWQIDCPFFEEFKNE